ADAGLRLRLHLLLGALRRGPGTAYPAPANRTAPADGGPRPGGALLRSRGHDRTGRPGARSRRSGHPLPGDGPDGVELSAHRLLRRQHRLVRTAPRGALLEDPASAAPGAHVGAVDARAGDGP